jgi:hypothetical protein
MYSSSPAESRVLSGTRTAPAHGTPLCSSSIVELFVHRAATRSPGETPRAASAPASRRERSANSR